MVSWVMLSIECSPCCDSLTYEGGAVVRVSVFISAKNIVPYRQFTFAGGLTSGACLRNNENALAAQAMNEREAFLTIPSSIKGRCLGSWERPILPHQDLNCSRTGGGSVPGA